MKEILTILINKQSTLNKMTKKKKYFSDQIVVVGVQSLEYIYVENASAREAKWYVLALGRPVGFWRERFCAVDNIVNFAFNLRNEVIVYLQNKIQILLKG